MNIPKIYKVYTDPLTGKCRFPEMEDSWQTAAETKLCGPWNAMDDEEALRKLRDEFHILDAMAAACVLDELRAQEQQEYQDKQKSQAIFDDIEDKTGLGWLDSIIEKIN
jgi:hypothetical protein